MKTCILFLTLILIGPFSILAQDEGVSNRNLEVEKNYSDEIYAVHPIFDFGNITLKENQKKKLKANPLLGSPIYTPDISIQVRPIDYSTDHTETGHNAMIKLDKGTINPWHIQAGYVLSKANHFNVQASFDYDSWQSKQVTDQSSNEINGNIGLDYYLTHNIKTHLGFHYSDTKYGLYGFQEPGIESTGSVNHYNNYGLDFSIGTYQTAPAKWNASLQLKLNQWKDKLVDTNRETLFHANGNVDYKATSTFNLSWSPQVVVSKSEVFSDGLILNNTLLATVNKSKMMAQVGISAAFFQSQWNIWPKLNGHLQLSPTDVVKFSANQNLQFWGAQEILNNNPYVDLLSLEEINNQSVDMTDKIVERVQEAEVSFTNTAIHKLELTGNLGYSNFSNASNYIIGNRAERLSLKQVDYKQINTSLNISRELIDGVNAELGVAYIRYMDQSTELLNRPSVIISPSINASLFNEKLDLGLSAAINNPQQLQNQDGAYTSSSWRTNLNFSSRYKLLDQVSIFINADNMLNDEYQVWSGYNNFGRNLSGGVLFKF